MNVRKHYFKAFWRTFLFYWDWKDKLWWRGVKLRHAFLMTLFGKLPGVIKSPLRIIGYETYIGDDGKERTVPIRKRLVDIALY